jgi:hypothetical protein
MHKEPRRQQQAELEDEKPNTRKYTQELKHISITTKSTPPKPQI